MIRQIKRFLLLFGLLILALPLIAQDEDTLSDQAYLDSIRQVLSNDYARQLDRYRQLSEQQSAANRIAIDSLQRIISDLDQELRMLNLGLDASRSEVGALKEAVEQNKAFFEAERLRFTQMLWITGPSLLALILLSTILFFLMLRRHQESADRKINALKKYTYTEIEDTRTTLLKKFRKRIKKLKQNQNDRAGSKQDKKGNKKKRKSGKKG